MDIQWKPKKKKKKTKLLALGYHKAADSITQKLKITSSVHLPLREIVVDHVYIPVHTLNTRCTSTSMKCINAIETYIPEINVL